MRDARPDLGEGRHMQRPAHGRLVAVVGERVLLPARAYPGVSTLNFWMRTGVT
eukprot:COSAG01_NODE_2962_length_6786_cov_21.580544_5_plen_53_part_00